MPLPELNDTGHLPPGLHDCVLGEVLDRFASPKSGVRRVQLGVKLQEFVRDVIATECVVEVIVDGSFVTADASPSDIDVLLVVRTGFDRKRLKSSPNNLVFNHTQSRRFYKFDVFWAYQESRTRSEYLEHFEKVKTATDRRKGVVRILI